MQWPFVPIKLWHLLSLVVILILNGCFSTPVVETQKLSPSKQLPVTEQPIVDTATHHTVKRGETLYGIATHYGRNYKDVARWNNIAPPYALNLGQRLRIAGPSNNDSFSSAPYTPGIDNSTVPQSSQNVPVASAAPNKSQEDSPKIVQTDNEPLNLIAAVTNANERVFGDLVGEDHKVLRKKTHGNWKSFSARFEKQGIRHKATTDALERVQLKRFIVDIEGKNCDSYTLRYFSVNDKSKVRHTFASVATNGDGLVMDFDGKKRFLYLQVDQNPDYRTSGRMLIHFDSGRFIIWFDPVKNSRKLYQQLRNGNKLAFGVWKNDGFMFTSTYSLQGSKKALSSAISACKTIGNR